MKYDPIKCKNCMREDLCRGGLVECTVSDSVDITRLGDPEPVMLHPNEAIEKDFAEYCKDVRTLAVLFSETAQAWDNLKAALFEIIDPAVTVLKRIGRAFHHRLTKKQWKRRKKSEVSDV